MSPSGNRGPRKAQSFQKLSRWKNLSWWRDWCDLIRSLRNLPEPRRDWTRVSVTGWDGKPAAARDDRDWTFLGVVWSRNTQAREQLRYGPFGTPKDTCSASSTSRSQPKCRNRVHGMPILEEKNLYHQHTDNQAECVTALLGSEGGKLGWPALLGRGNPFQKENLR